MASVGASVARARLARESMMRFTHSIWTAVKGDSRSTTAPTHAVKTATTLIVSCITPEENGSARGPALQIGISFLNCQTVATGFTEKIL